MRKKGNIFINFETVFHPVGQGLFTSLDTDIMADSKCYNFSVVYDCGSSHKYSRYLKREIKQYICHRNHHIDILFLSHLHYDHVSGLNFLLKYTTVDMVVLPYISPYERIIVALMHPLSLPLWYFEFLSDPATYLLERGVGNVVYLSEPREGYEGEGPDFPPENFPRRIDIEREELPRRPFVNFDDLKMLPKEDISRKLSLEPIQDKLNKFIEEKKLVFRRAFGVAWASLLVPFLIFIPFVKRIDPAKLRIFKNCVSQTIQQNIPPRNYSKLFTSPNINNLRKCYNNIANNLNLTSMTVYVSPIFSQLCSEKAIIYCCFNDFNSCYPTNITYCPCMLIKNKMKLNNLCGIMLMGDLPIKQLQIVSSFNRYYHNYLDKIAVYQIPHHGGKDSFNSHLGIKTRCGVVSYGINNSFNHPNRNILQQYKNKIKINKIFHVNENAEFSFQLIGNII